MNQAPRFFADSVPLGATLGRVEIECAAAVILYVLHSLGREWSAPVTDTEIGAAVGAAVTARTEPLWRWMSNPFLRAGFVELERRGFAVRGESPSGLPTTALTPAALERLAPHLAPLELPLCATRGMPETEERGTILEIAPISDRCPQCDKVFHRPFRCSTCGVDSVSEGSA